jgi:serine/threonine protein kinase
LVRLSRQLAHPKVCRVYDIDEVDGRHFLSMEFIDGEDLQGLLRRIGRLPRDKGLEIAQQLCAGLAAAHEKGVLHRDLKPANVMIDGRGQARITDFGLARLEGSASGVGEIAGTPAYMASRTIGARRDDDPKRPLLAGADPLRNIHGPTGAPERLDRGVESHDPAPPDDAKEYGSGRLIQALRDLDKSM